MAVALLLHPQHFLSIRTQIALDRVGGVGSGEWGVGSGEWGAKKGRTTYHRLLATHHQHEGRHLGVHLLVMVIIHMCGGGEDIL